MNTILNKKILITGSTNGLGKYLSKRFIECGCNVCISGRNEEKCKIVSDELNCPYVYLDVLKIEQFKDKLYECDSLLNGVDILINNAGISFHIFNILNTNTYHWEKIFNTNCRAPYFLTKEFIDYQINYKKCDNIRKVLFTASNAAIYGYDDLYPLTKNFLLYFTNSIADKYFKYKLRFNCISPSGIENTGMNNNGNHDCENSCRSNLSKKSLSMEEIFNMYLFLCMDENNSINGANFIINEGKKF